jgi:hypothetical protein
MNIKAGYVDKHGAREYTSCSVRALDYARQRAELPYFRRGRKVVFSLADLDRWMSRFRIDPTDLEDESDKP